MQQSQQTAAYDATAAVQTLTETATAVHVVPDRDEWNVVIIENGIERLQSFVQHDWALSYARGQRLRLGLPAPTDPPPATA
ncbi:hypothetical protein ASG39_03410 [Rhizobium sp. Leaf371]|uniref:hypothetical protein n=1 Tax=Rhizobium sp. Leaf371 TaxID=1736355 RepID=UPI000715A513|nr:hypothetical protein [Rhizobium sp. Leaf371]KQS72800.1 hypothetical protein ASG39_03410 [Rhizobium sp. Leaf371]